MVPGGGVTDALSISLSIRLPCRSIARHSVLKSTVFSYDCSIDPKNIWAYPRVRRALPMSSKNSEYQSYGSVCSLFAATIMRIAYGIVVKDENDEYVSMAEEGLAAFSSLLVPGKYLAELFPILRHVPRWVPGADFRGGCCMGQGCGTQTPGHSLGTYT